jgi:hypothetical protein
MAKKNYLKNLIANSKLASKVGLGMLLVAPLFMASSCEKPCDKTDPKSDCYVQPPEPPVPPVEQRDTVIYFSQGDMEPIKDTANLRAVAALPEIRTVYLSPKDGSVWTYPGTGWHTVIENIFEPAINTSPSVTGNGDIKTKYPGTMFTDDSTKLVNWGWTVNSPGKDWKANNFSKKIISKGYQKGKGYRGR